MSRRGRRLQRRIRGRRPMRVEYVLTNWKLRLAYLVASVGIGAWEALIFHWRYALAIIVSVAVALLRIWVEVRQHEPHD